MSEAMTKRRVAAHLLMVLWLLLMVWRCWPWRRVTSLFWIVSWLALFGNPLIYAACGWHGGCHKSFAFAVVYPVLLSILLMFGPALCMAAALGPQAVPRLLVRVPFIWPVVVFYVVWLLPWPIAWLYGRRKRRWLEAAPVPSDATRVEQK